MLNGMGTRYRNIFNTLPFKNEDKKKEYDTVTKLFDAHFAVNEDTCYTMKQGMFYITGNDKTE